MGQPGGVLGAFAFVPGGQCDDTDRAHDGRELWAIGRERSAVYFENERIFFLGIEMRWCRYPALYFEIIGR